MTHMSPLNVQYTLLQYTPALLLLSHPKLLVGGSGSGYTREESPDYSGAGPGFIQCSPSNREFRPYQCNSNQYCCPETIRCCPVDRFDEDEAILARQHAAMGFSRLWYFWLMLMMALLFCSGGGYWYKRRTVFQFHGTHMMRSGAANNGVPLVFIYNQNRSPTTLVLPSDSNGSAGPRIQASSSSPFRLFSPRLGLAVPQSPSNPNPVTAHRFSPCADPRLVQQPIQNLQQGFAASNSGQSTIINANQAPPPAYRPSPGPGTSTSMGAGPGPGPGRVVCGKPSEPPPAYVETEPPPPAYEESGTSASTACTSSSSMS